MKLKKINQDAKNKQKIVLFFSSQFKKIEMIIHENDWHPTKFH